MNVKNVGKLTKIGHGTCAGTDVGIEGGEKPLEKMAAFPRRHFSAAAQQLLDDKLRRYEKALEDASQGVAKCCHSDSVSVKHVQIAAGRVSVCRSRGAEFMIAVGGILLGSTVGNAFNLICSNGPVGYDVFLATFLVGVAGMYTLVKGLYAN